MTANPGQQIVELCRRLHQKNMLSASDGNVSVRLDDDRILITPSGLNKSFIHPEDLAVITLDNQIVSGNPSGERLMHLEVFRKAPQARCVVHAHPPTAIAWTLARPELAELPNDLLSEVILAVGRIPIVPYARPGTAEMGTALSPFLPECRVLILARHGALSWGEDSQEAYNGMERLEHSALILHRAQTLAGTAKLRPLPPAEIEFLRNLRARGGGRTL